MIQLISPIPCELLCHVTLQEHHHDLVGFCVLHITLWSEDCFFAITPGIMGSQAA